MEIVVRVINMALLVQVILGLSICVGLVVDRMISRMIMRRAGYKHSKGFWYRNLHTPTATRPRIVNIQTLTCIDVYKMLF